MQLIHAIPLICKQKIDDSRKNVETDNVVEDHHLIKNTRVIVLENSFREKCKQKHLCVHFAIHMMRLLSIYF